PERADLRDEVLGLRRAETDRDALDVVEMAPPLHVEGRLAQRQRIVEAALDVDVEPVVDAAVDERDREEIDDHERRHRERDEQRDHAQLEPRARHVPAKIAQKPREVDGDQRDQQRDAERVHEQNPVLQAREVVRILGDPREQQERREPQHHAESEEHGPQRSLYSPSKRHSYQSLERLKSLRQNARRRSGPGYRSVSSTTRILRSYARPGSRSDASISGSFSIRPK